DGRNGHLIGVDDAEALAGALDGLLADPAQRQQMGLESRLIAVAQFDARENARRLFEFVRSRC
ncbi:MAG TPA: hypothetical protein VGC79_03880, partial [Polyangiaceae bacterium]